MFNRFFLILWKGNFKQQLYYVKL